MKIKRAQKALAMIIISAICFALFSFGTAAVFIDTRGSITLTTLSKENKEPVSGAVFRIYYLASAHQSGDGISFVYTDEFKNNGMGMGNFSDAYLPVHLSAYAQSMSIAYTEKATDKTGKVVFDNLPCGAYLVVPMEIDEGYLNPTPFVVTVPMKGEGQNNWIYHIDATPKIEIGGNDTDEKTYISVKKYWQGTDNAPDSITVLLIKDGVISDSVVLSDANNWYHKWEDLNKNHSWNVVEANVPEDYKVSYVTSQMTVIITNTHKTFEEETTTAPEETTTSGDTTTTDNTTSPDGTTTTQPSTKPTGTTESTTKPEELIDTGQLNWPVPIFSIIGLLVFSTGWIILNFSKKDEDAA